MKSYTLMALVASTLLGSAFADGCTVDSTADKDRCIGVSCTTSNQCLSGYCLGLPNTTFFRCGGCNDNNNATGYKCPNRYCNVYTECAVPQCMLFTNGTQKEGWNGTCGGVILDYEGLHQWEIITIAVGSSVGALIVILIVSFSCAIKKYKKRAKEAEEKVRLIEG